jgi:pimeloyl-ACP methyl ester carboxylesterase
VRKNLIIIPGSCSDQLNWFDQINYYKKLGWQVGFLDLNAAKYKTMQDCADAIELALENLVNEETVIMSHSMGAMLMFRVLSKSTDASLEKLFKKIKIFFIQMPCDSEKVGLMRASMPLVSLAMTLHKFLVHWWLEPLLYSLKKLFAFGYKNPFFMPINFLLNFAAMNTSFWKATPQEALSLMKYYENWQDFFDHNNADLNSYENLYFTYGQPDPVCNTSLIIDLGKRFTNLKILKMPLGFHNPHHFFWYQEKFDRLVLSRTVE